MRVDYYTMLFDGEWWACVEGCGDLEFCGKEYVKVAECEGFVGAEGQVVLGWLEFKKVRGMIGDYKFHIVAEEGLAAVHLADRVVSKAFMGYNEMMWNSTRRLKRKFNLPQVKVINHGTEDSPIYEYKPLA